MEVHKGHQYEADVCATFLKMLLPALSFVESKDIEVQLLTLCLRAMKRLVSHTLQGKGLYADIIEICRSNNFILLRARAQEQVSTLLSLTLSLPIMYDDCTNITLFSISLYHLPML